MDIRTVEREKILLVGYKKNTRSGFCVIGRCWHKLHAAKGLIANRKNADFLIGLNDYTLWDVNAEKQPAFDYYAASEVGRISTLPSGMEAKILPAARYIVFSFRAKSEDSLQPVADYIYKEWFPQSTCRFNEQARYDFARYGEERDSGGMSRIEYWVPII